MNNDPWKHRSAAMSCKTCMWFVEKARSPMRIENVPVPGTVASGPTMAIVHDSQIVGRCRRHAPTMNGYPVVFESDWCGDHKLDENKVVG